MRIILEFIGEMLVILSQIKIMLIRDEMIRSTVLMILYSPRYEHFLEPVEDMSFNPLRQYLHVKVGP